MQFSLEVMRQFVGMVEALNCAVHVTRVTQILEARRIHAQDFAVLAGRHLRACPKGTLHKICELGELGLI